MKKRLHVKASMVAKLHAAWKYLFFNVVYSPFLLRANFFFPASPSSVVGLKGGSERKVRLNGVAFSRFHRRLSIEREVGPRPKGGLSKR